MLTHTVSLGNIDLPLPHVRDGIGVPNVAAQPLICGFFVSNAQPSIVVGWAEQLSSWPGATSVRQLRSVRLPMIGVIRRRVFNLFSGVAIMLKNHTQEPTNTLNKTVSETESKLIELSQVIGSIADSNTLLTHGLAEYIHYLDKSLSTLTFPELVEIINEYREAFNYPKTPHKKTSRFNVLSKSKQLIAKSVPYSQAKQYQDCIVKFDRMEGVL